MTLVRDVKLAHITTLITKGTTPTTVGLSFSEQGVNFIKAESVTLDGRIDSGAFAYVDEATHAKLKRSQIQPGDILFSIAGMKLGKSAVVKKEHVPANTNQALAIIRLDQTVAVPEFVHYYFLNPRHYALVNSLTGQTAQPNINLRQVGELDIRLPPPDTQRRIAGILSAYDDLIEVNTRRLAILEEMARRLFDDWFVKFKYPGHGADKIVSTEIGPVPEGWSIVAPNALGDLLYGHPFKSKAFNTDAIGLPIIRIRDIKASISGTYTDEIARPQYLVSDGDILIGMDGEFHMTVWSGGGGLVKPASCTSATQSKRSN